MTFEHIAPLMERLRTDAEAARREYQANPPKGHCVYEPASPVLLRTWLSLTVTFELQSPWFSKDDLSFHVLNNPVRRDHVFLAPFIPASSWKGLLRWAARMKTGLLAHLEANSNTLRDWSDPVEVVHLFGNERETDHFQRGALAFRPTWFDKVSFEVINPHDRSRKAGTKPILYEVVPPSATGTVDFLYAPAPHEATADLREQGLLLLFNAVESLLTEYGISAKRTSGWGIATITTASLRWRGGACAGPLANVRDEAMKILGGLE